MVADEGCYHGSVTAVGHIIRVLATGFPYLSRELSSCVKLYSFNTHATGRESNSGNHYRNLNYINWFSGDLATVDGHTSDREDPAIHTKRKTCLNYQ